MQQFDKVWGLWLTFVIIWNFGWPNAHPMEDVIIAILLSIAAYQYKIKKT
jgi:hypothetical protein|tara:strand:+ start:5040 stop:5189 length:150 start_codon:yes stop_codon:yes gene_type:complete